MGDLHYEPVIPRSREELQAAFEGGEPTSIHDALISAAYWEQDWKWAQDQCLHFVDHSSEMVRSGAAYALGLIAVFHAKLSILPLSFPRYADYAKTPPRARLRKRRWRTLSTSSSNSRVNTKQRDFRQIGVPERCAQVDAKPTCPESATEIERALCPRPRQPILAPTPSNLDFPSVLS